jgi:hypothetical protein
VDTPRPQAEEDGTERERRLLAARAEGEGARAALESARARTRLGEQRQAGWAVEEAQLRHQLRTMAHEASAPRARAGRAGAGGAGAGGGG